MYKLHGRVWNGFLFIWTTGGFLWNWWIMWHGISSKYDYTESNLSTEFNNMQYADLLSGICQMILHYIWILFPELFCDHFLSIYFYLTGVFFKCKRYIPPNTWWPWAVSTLTVLKEVVLFDDNILLTWTAWQKLHWTSCQCSHILGECVRQVLLKYKHRALLMQVFCDITLHCWVCNSWCFEDSTAVKFRSMQSKKKALQHYIGVGNEVGESIFASCSTFICTTIGDIQYQYAQRGSVCTQSYMLMCR
jgi:hypothetical protein